VAGHHGRRRAAQSGDVDGVADERGARDDVGGIPGRQAVEEPEGVLAVGEAELSEDEGLQFVYI
jgi:hypothetical protein